MLCYYLHEFVLLHAFTVGTCFLPALPVRPFVFVTGTLATTDWSSGNGTKGQWHGSKSGTNHLGLKVKDEETVERHRCAG